MKNLLIIAGLALVPITPAFAQDAGTAGGQADVAEQAGADGPHGPINFVAIGAGVTPKYPGSKTYSVIPFAVADVTVEGVELSVRGPNVRANVLGDRSPFELGPVVAVNFGRHQSDGGVARNLMRLGNEVDLGGYVGYRVGGNQIGQGQTEFEVTGLQDVSSVSKGYTVNGNVSYILLRDRRWNLGLDANTTFASARTLRTYFGVTPTDSLASGLSQYTPGSGFRDVGGGLTAGYQLSDHWGVISRFGYNYLLGDAARSPIVKAGSRNQLLAGAAISYRF